MQNSQQTIVSHFNPKNIFYSYRIVNTSSEWIQQASFYTYSPVPITAYQELKTLDVSAPYQLISDKLGNQVIHFQLENFAPYANRMIKIKAQLLTSHDARREAVKDPENYLQNTPWLAMQHPSLILLAEKLNRGSAQQTIENIFLWTMRSIRYEGYRAEEKKVSETLQTLAGDCTDYMHVFTALSRRNHIPTRELGGYVVKQNQVLQAQDFHNWAEYFLDDYWQIADPQNKILNKKGGDYIAFKRYGEDPSSPLNSYHRFYVTDDRLKILMN